MSHSNARLHLKYSLMIPVFFIAVIWLVKITEWLFGLDFSDYGLLPRSVGNLTGILASPLIHSSFKHLFANTSPMFVLSWGLFYFYRRIAYRAFLYMYLLSGILLWLVGREAYHIGASGMVYALAAFLFLSGVLRMHFRLIAISLVVVFLYGSLFWGIFPIMKGVSWDGHLCGAIAGFGVAYLMRKQGPQKPPPLEEDEEEVIPEEIWNNPELASDEV